MSPEHLISRSTFAQHKSLSDFSDMKTLESRQPHLGGPDWTDKEQTKFINPCQAIRAELNSPTRVYESLSNVETLSTEQNRRFSHLA
jgi:hypothetical protein